MRTELNFFLRRVDAIERTKFIRDRLVEFGREPVDHLNPYAVQLHFFTTELGESGLQPMLDGSVLLLCAAFEQFVADVMISYAQRLPAMYPAYPRLPRAVRTANEGLTGDALSNRNPGFEPHEKQRFVENLRVCLSGNAPYVLNGEAIAFNRQNLKADRLRDLFGRLGVHDIWNVISNTQAFRKWEPSLPRTTALGQARADLNKLVDDRNQIAHKVGGAAPGPGVVRSYLELARAVARSLVEILEIISTMLTTGAAYTSVLQGQRRAPARL